MAFLSIKNLSFAYQKELVIKNFSLEAEKGSFTTLLGESGSGKTTLLNLINGFLTPRSGAISVNGAIINALPVRERKIGMVFQDYALFPHLSVEQNLLYGLKIKNPRAKEQNAKKIFQIAQTLQIEHLLNRFPAELSGGQQQRVALGRVLVLEPDLLLMDEPLSSLDTKMRIRVREELKETQRKLQITTLYVTHDQEEALSLSDNIVILRDGNVMQSGTPEEIYFTPKNRFAAEFSGKTNFIQNKLVRPEWIEMTKRGQDSEKSVPPEKIKGQIIGKNFLGAFTDYTVQSEGQTIVVSKLSATKETFKIGDKVFLAFLRTHVIYR